MTDLAALAEAVRDAQPAPGSLLAVKGEVLRLALPGARVGERVRVGGVLAEVVGFEVSEAVALPLEPAAGLASGAAVVRESDAPRLPAVDALVGRIIDGLGRAVDGGPALPPPSWPVHRRAPDPLVRAPVTAALPLGVRVLDALCTLGQGQRLGLEAGPGVGKSTLLRQIAAQAEVDVVVLALIGERGREVGAFLARLPAETRARAVVVVARADDPPLVWLRAAEVATAVAEGHREAGKSVLLLMDSLTRVARAIRTVGVAAGEPVTRRGFPVSLATEVARLLERAANDGHGTLTALYTVLVEGDAVDDPVAEEARALLDGHIVLDAAAAGAGRFPAVDVARSVSRCMDDLVDEAHRRAARTLRRWLAGLARQQDLLAVGAYQTGADPDADAALRRRPAIEAFLRQGPTERTPLAETRRRLLELCP
ncbi:MAG: FliI/YscN family ATPase [bacterium]